jgi:hypothetical protein
MYASRAGTPAKSFREDSRLANHSGVFGGYSFFGALPRRDADDCLSLLKPGLVSKPRNVPGISPAAFETSL